MAFTNWAAGTAYAVGDVRRATTLQDTGLVFKVTAVSGSSPYTSGSSEPAWPTVLGSTAVDNEITWTAVSTLYEELAVLEPNTIIDLYEIHLQADLHGSTDVYRFHSGMNEAVTQGIQWNSNTYTPAPVDVEGFQWSSAGSFPRPTVSLGNLDGSITTLMALVNGVTPGNDLTGSTFKRIRVLKKHLDGEADADPYAQWPTEVYLIDRKAGESRSSVVFELASELDRTNQKIPKRQLIANVCQWEYRSTECGYSGSNYWDVNDVSTTSLSLDRCGKRISSCKLRFGGTNGNDPLPFGSFPGIDISK